MHPYRIFICYAHADQGLAAHIAEYLRELGMIPLWDKAIRDGDPISQAIIDLIPRAHVFLPLITENSVSRPWVHQETGLAVGLNVPCLPIATEGTPTAMITELKAIVLKDAQGNLPTLKESLSRKAIEHKAESGLLDRATPFEIADDSDQRVDTIVRYAEEVYVRHGPSRLRLDAAFSSFCIPTEPIDDKIWDDYEGDARRTPKQRELRWRERRAIEKHAKEAGCDMIIHPSLKLEENGEHARRTRLRILLSFLKKHADSQNIRVAVRPKVSRQNQLIVGDHFSAVSRAPRAGVGYTHTPITWHAASVLKQLRDFDEIFEACLENPVPPRSPAPAEPRQTAVEIIKEIINESEQARGDAS